MITEEQLSNWTKPSSDHEESKQERTVKNIKEALDDHPPLTEKMQYKVYAKGSYANNTNVRLESDVDIAVEATGERGGTDIFCYSPENDRCNTVTPYKDSRIPYTLRSEITLALKKKFVSGVDTSTSTAIKIHSGPNDSRVDADVVPCFTYRHVKNYFDVSGVQIFKKNNDQPELRLRRDKELSEFLTESHS